MTAGIERDLLARAEELADTADLAGWITEIIGWAGAELARARGMPTADPCQGCHHARVGAIQAAQRELEDARERGDCAGAALEALAPLKLPQALRAVRRVPEDLREVYAAAYDLVTRDPGAMPKDGDFITGETTPAAMAAKMLAARAGTSGFGDRGRAAAG